MAASLQTAAAACLAEEAGGGVGWAESEGGVAGGQ